MNKKEFISRVQEIGGYDTLREAKEAVNAFQDTLFQVLSEKDGVRLNGLGSFTIRDKKERTYTIGEKTIVAPAHKVVKFIPHEPLKKIIND